jgi:hypothetical protein
VLTPYAAFAAGNEGQDAPTVWQLIVAWFEEESSRIGVPIGDS